jgi:hypothetical protein
METHAWILKPSPHGLRPRILREGDLKEKVFRYFPGIRMFAWENGLMPV